MTTQQANNMAATSAIILEAGLAITGVNNHQDEAKEPETFYLNSNLFPCVCVAMYESPLSSSEFERKMEEIEQMDGNEFNYCLVDGGDWTKELTRHAQDYINDNVIESLRDYGVVSIEATGIWSPKYYNYQSDELNMTITMQDDWREIMAAKVAGWRDNEAVRRYICKHWRSCSGYINFMPETLDEVVSEDDEDRQLAAYLTLAMLVENVLDEDEEEGSRSLWTLAEIMDEQFCDYRIINVIEEYYSDKDEAQKLQELWDDDLKWNELYWTLREKIGSPWLRDKDSHRLWAKEGWADFDADSDGKRLLFWAVQQELTVKDLYNMAA